MVKSLSLQVDEDSEFEVSMLNGRIHHNAINIRHENQSKKGLILCIQKVKGKNSKRDSFTTKCYC